MDSRRIYRIFSKYGLHNEYRVNINLSELILNYYIRSVNCVSVFQLKSMNMSIEEQVRSTGSKAECLLLIRCDI